MVTKNKDDIPLLFETLNNGIEQSSAVSQIDKLEFIKRAQNEETKLLILLEEICNKKSVIDREHTLDDWELDNEEAFAVLKFLDAVELNLPEHLKPQLPCRDTKENERITFGLLLISSWLC